MSRSPVITFSSDLGWMALVVREDTVCGLTFGHASRKQAMQKLGGAELEEVRAAGRAEQIAQRLCSYAAGSADDFLDVPIDSGPLTPFQRAVEELCRRIPIGETATYGQLAARAGRPGASRAVGNAMSRNRIPLIVPCHRVVAAGGRIGGYSAPSGLTMKRRLLALEQAARPVGLKSLAPSTRL